ncbi:MAG: polysaccharide deacetylase family protein [Verrucomicrobiota bacterium]|nr:polysaccharide deacetylase family protein [Verrucomicrobiota bacterium]
MNPAGAVAALPTLFASAAAEKQPLIVSVHDVAPPTRAACDAMLRDLARHGVDVCSLLVVPDYHHTGAAMKDGEFVRWLRDLEDAGHEIVIHGYFHERPRRARESFRARLITRSYTSDEGEFYDLEYSEALRRITAAHEQFRAAGLTPRGFIAPAWLLSAAGEQAAADAEMEYTTRLTAVLDLRTRRSFHARSLVYSVRSSWRRKVSLAWNRSLAELQRGAPLLRLGLHPPDISHPEIWAQILALASDAAAARTPVTYRDWISTQRQLQTAAPLT